MLCLNFHDQLSDSTLCRRWSATKTLRSAKGLRPRKVVRRFNSDNGISRSNLAMHSSANEFDTTLTPVKSRTTFSLPLINGKSFSRSICPMSRVPKSVPYSMNLNSTITIPILLFLQMLRYTLLQRQFDDPRFGWDRSPRRYQFPYR